MWAENQGPCSFLAPPHLGLCLLKPERVQDQMGLRCDSDATCLATAIPSLHGARQAPPTWAGPCRIRPVPLAEGGVQWQGPMPHSLVHAGRLQLLGLAAQSLLSAPLRQESPEQAPGLWAWAGPSGWCPGPCRVLSNSPCLLAPGQELTSHDSQTCPQRWPRVPWGQNQSHSRASGERFPQTPRLTTINTAHRLLAEHLCSWTGCHTCLPGQHC